jgi:hypothetical protein
LATLSDAIEESVYDANLTAVALWPALSSRVFDELAIHAIDDTDELDARIRVG